MSHSEVLGIRISTYAIWRATIQPLTVKSTEMEKLLVPPLETTPGSRWHLMLSFDVREREASAPV